MSWYLFNCAQLLDQSLQCHVTAGTTSFQKYVQPGSHNLLQPGSRAARKWRENEIMKRGNGKWRENEEMERDWLSTFPHSLFISYIKICHILMQNAKYGTFVANVTKIITYALWGNTSGSVLLRGSSASCAGLSPCIFVLFGKLHMLPILTKN